MPSSSSRGAARAAMAVASLAAAFFLAPVAYGGTWAGPGSSSTAWPEATAVVGYESEKALRAALERAPARIVERLPQLSAAAVRPEGTVIAFAQALATAPGIEYVEPLAGRRPQAEPALLPAGAPGGMFQWQYAATKADHVPASILAGAAAVAVAVVDSGADLSAPDLAAKRPRSYNAVTGTTDVTDTVGHGTFVASLAAGSPSNGEGIAGMGGEARLLVIKAGGRGLSDFDVAAAITYAVDRGAKVVNLSLGGVRGTTTELRAVEYAAAHDVLLVAAIGNEYRKGNPVEYPAAYLQPVGSNGRGGRGLAVGATTLTGARADFSNTGSHISLAAPGEDVFGAISSRAARLAYPATALPGSSAGLYGYGSGTSYAAPQVAGAAALVWAANPLLSAEQVADILEQTASGRGSWNPELGFGVLDAAAAVERARTTPAVMLTAAKAGTKAYLSWASRGKGASSYRLSVSVPGRGERVLLDRTGERRLTFDGVAGKTHAFRVEALDAAGAVLARSATKLVTLGQARATLALGVWRPDRRRPRQVLILAFLQSQAPDVKSSTKMIRLESFQRGRWSAAGFGVTDAGGRTGWQGTIRGTLRLRARFSGSRELAPAVSRPVVLRAG
jgi:subtilisin family serine protease